MRASPRSAPAEGSITCGVNRSFVTSSRYVRSRPLPLVLRLAVGVELDFEAALGVLDELAFHVAAQVEVAAVGDAFQLAELARRQERKRVLDVGRADGVVAQLVLARARAAAAARRRGRGSVYHVIRRSRQYSYHLRDVVRMAEELDLHLLELARAEREIPRRDLVAKALADLGDAERNAARACCRARS